MKIGDCHLDRYGPGAYLKTPQKCDVLRMVDFIAKGIVWIFPESTHETVISSRWLNVMHVS